MAFGYRTGLPRLAGIANNRQNAAARTSRLPKEGQLANKTTRLLQDALTRAAAEPAGLPLFAARNSPGLFPAGARTVAQRCRDEGYLQQSANDTGRKAAGEAFSITEKGLDWLLSQSSPKQIIEDFVRVLEERRGQVLELIETAKRFDAGMAAMVSVVQRLRPHSPERNGHASGKLPNADESLSGEICRELEIWQQTESGDCPLPELYGRIDNRSDGKTIGCFHDALRELHSDGLVWLHPWTGPLYEMPEPPLAMLIGHEIAYYVSLRNAQ
jgi:hypothetical protein